MTRGVFFSRALGRYFDTWQEKLKAEGWTDAQIKKQEDDISRVHPHSPDCLRCGRYNNNVPRFVPRDATRPPRLAWVCACGASYTTHTADYVPETLKERAAAAEAIVRRVFAKYRVTLSPSEYGGFIVCDDDSDEYVETTLQGAP